VHNCLYRVEIFKIPSEENRLKNMGNNKRKADGEGALPDAIKMDQVEGTGPFAVYFPSGFNPEKAAAECEWATFEHEQKKNQYAVVAKTVRYELIPSDHMVMHFHFYACNTNLSNQAGCSKTPFSLLPSTFFNIIYAAGSQCGFPWVYPKP
jgi:hypothetical protein